MRILNKNNLEAKTLLFITPLLFNANLQLSNLWKLEVRKKTKKPRKSKKNNWKNRIVKKNRLKFWKNRLVWFRFYKSKTKKTKPNPNKKKPSQIIKKPSQIKKTEPNRFEPVFVLKNRTEPDRFEPVSVFFLNNFGLVIFFW